MSDGDPFDGLQREHYGALLVDPPWRFKTYNEAGRLKCPDWRRFKGSPALHYETMSADELCELPVGELALPDSCLFMWISWPLLLPALDIIAAWGFAYKTCAFAWLKADVSTVDLFPDAKQVAIGTGYWTRANSEVCLLATRGHPKRLRRDVRQGIIEPRREHSRKPDCVHARIERLVSGPYLELFAREEREGWTSWGNEVTKFGSIAAQ